jgi:asparagine synthase (glutamine-hydrolysing)
LLPQALQRFLSRLRGFPLDDVSAFSLLRREIVDELDLRRQWHEQGFDPAYRIRGTSAQLRAHQIFDQLQLSRDVGGMDVDRGGIERRDPYSDRELIEFCLSVPETLFQRDGIKRWFARQVFADRLPPEILNENRRGEQAPNWFESLSARKPIIVEELERLQSSRLASRLIDLPRLKHLIDEWPKDVREAESRAREYRLGLDRAIHVGQFIRWVEGGNA